MARPLIHSPVEWRGPEMAQRTDWIHQRLKPTTPVMPWPVLPAELKPALNATPAPCAWEPAKKPPKLPPGVPTPL